MSLSRTLKRGLLVAGCAVALGFAATPSITLAASDLLRIGLQADLSSFDPTRLNTGTGVTTNLLYNSLIYLDAGGTPHPELAKSWSFSPDGRTLTLNLVDGVTFHDGRKMTSKDVAYSLEYAGTPAVGANILPFTKLIQQVDTPNDDTVVLHVNGSQRVIYDLLDLLYVIDSQHPKDIFTSGNGTGPYKLVSFDPGQSAEFVLYDKYWGQKPAIKRVEIKELPDAQSALAQLRAGAVDFLPTITRENAAQLAGSRFKTGIASADALGFDVGINVDKPPFDKPEVRKAVSLALDRKRIAAEIGGPGSIVKCLPWTELDKADSAGLEDSCPYDPAQAKALIAKAGATGATVEILSSGQSAPEIGTLAQVMQSSLAQIGLNARITDLAGTAFVAQFRKSQFQLTSHSYGRASRSAQALLMSAVVFWAKGNVMGVKSQSYEDDVNLVVNSPTDTPETAAAWKRIDQFMLSDNWVLPLATNPIRWASSPKLSGVAFSLDGAPNFDGAVLN
ncbi:MAG TPA: ABC transporter substrate-binding protein [Devosiaceae bacterium]|nr:ABC transporter substrate-binding protein [Devosiaceae bacterium]